MAENLIIIKANGSRVPIDSRRTATQITSAKQTWALNGEEKVNVSVTSTVAQSFDIGDCITVFGRTYRLNRLPKVQKQGSHKFQYDLEFEGVQYDLFRVTYDLNVSTVNNSLQDVQGDSLTGDLQRFLTVIIANANRVFPGKWAIGSCPATEQDKTLTFGESDNCLSVLQKLCTEFNVEFWIDPTSTGYVINMMAKVGQTLPYTFRYGRGGGLYLLTRDNVSSANIVTRLKVYGSTENITSKYRADRLCLHGQSKATSIIENAAAIARYGVFEGRKNFDDIKPNYTGKVTALVDGDVLKFTDSNFPFDLNAKEADGKTTKYLLDGVSAKIHFNSGNLAGYEFDVHSYDHTTKTFTIVRITDDRGDKFPSDNNTVWRFAKNDQYKILDVTYPDNIIEAAEAKLLEEGTKYYNENSQPKVSYGLSVTKEWVEATVAPAGGGVANLFAPGDYLHVIDDDIAVDKSVRIKSFTRDILDEYDYQITLSDTVKTTSVGVRILDEIGDIDKILDIHNLKNPTTARANWRSSREVLNMVFDPEGDYYTDKIKPNSVDTLCLSVGAKSMQFGLADTQFQPNYNKNPNAVAWKGGVLTHYTINEDHAVNWTLNNGAISFPDKNARYIYARCERNGNAGTIVFDTAQHTVEEDPMYYWFWIGVLNSVDSELGARSISLTYGFSMINGRFIKTGCIMSYDGKTYFDLDNNVIKGNIMFRGSDGQYHDVATFVDDTKEKQEFVTATLDNFNSMFSGFQNQIDGKIETWYQTTDPSTAWKTDDERAKHVGDLWFNTDTKESKRYNSSYAWEIIENKDAQAALEAASNAQDTADGKRTVFTTTPKPPYYVGDLWVQGGGGDILCCNKARPKETDSFVSSDWVKASKYTGDENLNAFIETYNATISDIYSQLDGVIETWFGNGVPTLKNTPAADWKSTEDYERHLGDIYYDNDTGRGFRFSKETVASGTGKPHDEYKWVEITDSALAEALAAAAQAQDTADGKRRVFVNTPYPPYDEGDLWASGTFLKVCKVGVHRASGKFVSSDWMDATEYTGDESLNKFIDGVFADTVSDIYNQIDGKLESWYSSTDPSTAWKTDDERAKHIGDQWYNTTAKTLWRFAVVSGVKPYPIYGWIAIENAAAIAAAEAASKAQDTADGKRRVFVTTPYPPYDVGDLWTDGADLWRCNNPKTEGQSYARSDWGKATNYTDDSTINDFINNTYTPDKETLESQIDGKIEAWFQSTDPAASWLTNAIRDLHVGDMWYNTSTKELKYYRANNQVVINPNGLSSIRKVYSWQMIEDQKAIDAYEAASNAQDTADGKRQVFVATPTTPYDEGDLWLNDGELWRCRDGVHKSEGEAYSFQDWEVAVDYDNTVTTINGGIVTSGTIQVGSEDKKIKAGMTGTGTAESSVRFWAGEDFAHRETAPYRVLQDGSVVMTKATVEGIIKALSGLIAGWTINTDSLASANNIIKLLASGSVMAGNDVRLDAGGLAMRYGGYDRLKICNADVGQFSEFILKESLTNKTVNGAMHTTAPYFYTSNTNVGGLTGGTPLEWELGFFDLNSSIDFNSGSIGFTVPSYNPTQNSGSNVGSCTMVSCVGAWRVDLICNGAVVKSWTWGNTQSYSQGQYVSLTTSPRASYSVNTADKVGTYKLRFSIDNNPQFRSPKSGTCTPTDVSVSVTLNFGFNRGNFEKTLLCRNGLMSCWESGAMFMSGEGFVVMFGNYGLRVNGSGIQKTTNAGVSWASI